MSPAGPQVTAEPTVAEPAESAAEPAVDLAEPAKERELTPVERAVRGPRVRSL